MAEDADVNLTARTLTDVDRLALATRAGGERELLLLWEAVYRFAFKLANRWSVALEGRTGADFEDFCQAAFLALLDALERWDSSTASFTTMFGFRLKTFFSEASGARTEKQRKDPLHWCASLDAPVMADDGDTLMLESVIPDKHSEMPFDEIAESDWQQRARMALETALDKLPPDQRDAVYGRFFEGRSTDRRAFELGMKRLRQFDIAETLRKWL